MKRYNEQQKQQQQRQLQQKTCQESTIRFPSIVGVNDTFASSLFVAIRLGYSWSPVLKDLLMLDATAYDANKRNDGGGRDDAILNAVDDTIEGLPPFALAAAAAAAAVPEQTLFNHAANNKNNNQAKAMDLGEMGDMLSDWAEAFSAVASTTSTSPTQNNEQQQHNGDDLCSICSTCGAYYYYHPCRRVSPRTQEKASNSLDSLLIDWAGLLPPSQEDGDDDDVTKHQQQLHVHDIRTLDTIYNLLRASPEVLCPRLLIRGRIAQQQLSLELKERSRVCLA
eukprot:CAMPEP_0178800238 /NCGR_PEP_ID=MMETSP0745-20121128/12725_1 /TAXON_ID=913974 /ORGANISM="Nitzschia punctata, Strain CCMP561" /LENGTH=280 /DNA_ID=CAMNT_0020459029 /DNA_START=243 /DNA_END=1085 /DNA_ORIENTATION=+